MSFLSNITLNLLLQAAAPAIQTLVTGAIGWAVVKAGKAFSALQKNTSQSNVEKMAWQLVLSAEQKFVDNSEKQAYVLDLLKSHFPKVKPELLDAAMEAAVAAWKNGRTDTATTKIMEVAG